jgi:acetate kinase
MQDSQVEVQGYGPGLAFILEWYLENGIISSVKDIDCIGFKCVLGKTNGANLLTPGILKEMEDLLFIAPVHNGPYLEGISELAKIIDAPMVGVFEPSFHFSVPEYRRYLGLPWEWHELGIQKYGFHGASHRFLAARAYQLLGSEEKRVVTVHLGGSSSICAHQDGRSVDINQDFSPNSGLLQGTRSGHIDGSALLYAMDRLGLSVREAQEEISHNAGIRSMAGLDTDDMRTITKAAGEGNHRAAMTVDLYIDGIRKTIGGYAAALGGLDALVLSGGIGENSAAIRDALTRNLEFMGIVIDPVRNENPPQGTGTISSACSRVKVAVIPTNEEAVVAWFAAEVVSTGRDLKPEEMIFRL